MKKIPSLFVRDYEKIITDMAIHSASTLPDGSTGIAFEIKDTKKGKFLATEKVTPGCEWVLAGEGVATRKWDGTAVLISEGVLFKRFDAKHGKMPPPYFRACQDPDPITGHWPGWVPVSENDPANLWIIEAFKNASDRGVLPDGTYEAIGPKIGGNKEKWENHFLVKHGTGGWGSAFYAPNDWTFSGLKSYLEKANIEGIVFHHPDGRMCKVKRSDFGLPW